MTEKVMKYQSRNFLLGSEEATVDGGEGIVRQNLGYDDTIFMARVVFEEGAIGYEHSHPHSQAVYVESGVFDFKVGSEIKRLVSGDGAYIPPNKNHGAVCIEAGVLLDVFSPIREDFLPENLEENET